MKTIHGIKGFLGTSLLDYPGRVAAVVFLSGCNLRCPYCHNSRLLGREVDAELEDLSLDELLQALERRRKLIDGVVVTGGEPTVHPQLTYLLRSLKPLGLSIKLDTNGLRATLLKVLFKERLIDYIAMDLKTSPDRYHAELGAPPDAAEALRETVAWLKSQTDLAYEFRTTCVPGLVQEQDMEEIVRLIAGAPLYALQQYLPTYVADPELSRRPPYPQEVLERFRNLAQSRVKHVELRNL